MDQIKEQAAIKSLRSQLRWISLKIQRQKGPEQLDYHILATSTSYSASSEEHNSNWKQVFAWLLANLTLVYVVVKFFTLAIIHLIRDRLAGTITVSSSRGSYLNRKCVTPDNHIFDINKQINYIDDWLYYLGTPVPSVRAVSTLGYLMAIMGILCIYLIGQIGFHLKRPRFSLYDFLLDRRKERLRFALKLKLLVDSLFDCVSMNERNIFIYVPKRRESHSNYFYVGDKEIEFDEELKADEDWKKNDKTQAASSSNSSTTATKSKESIRYPIEDRVLLNRKWEDLVPKPNHLNDWWHGIICRSVLSIIPVSRYAFGSIPIIALLVVVIIEAYLRSIYRTELLKCESKNLTLSPQYLTPIRLSPLKNDEDLEFYRIFNDETTKTWKYLIGSTLIEAKLHLSLRSSLILIEVISCIFIGAFIFPLYFGIYALHFYGRYIRLDQIRLQLRDCISYLSNSLQTNRSARYHNKQYDMFNEQRNIQLELLTSTYLNYELFRRDHKNHQSLADLLILQAAVMNVQTLIICYICTLNKNEYVLIPLALTTYVGAVTNFYLITSAIHTSNILKLMKDLTYLVALSAENNLGSTMIARLWAKQIPNSKEILICFAPKLFGISLTFDKILTLNSYLFLLWYIGFLN